MNPGRSFYYIFGKMRRIVIFTVLFFISCLTHAQPIKVTAFKTSVITSKAKVDTTWSEANILIIINLKKDKVVFSDSAKNLDLLLPQSANQYSNGDVTGAFHAKDKNGKHCFFVLKWHGDTTKTEKGYIQVKYEDEIYMYKLKR